MKLDSKDRDNIIAKYSEAFAQYGYSSQSVLWGIEEKQIIRFDILTSQYDFTDKTVLDIGCGFGDMAKYLSNKFTNVKYIGVDINEAIIGEARKNFQDNENIKFYLGDFSTINITENIDYVVLSGTFNIAYTQVDQYEFVESYIKESLNYAKDGLAFNFLSDKVNFTVEGYSNFNPERILGIAYKYTRNVALLNNYMPFDFTLFMMKDDSFDDKRIFNLYNKRNEGK